MKIISKIKDLFSNLLSKKEPQLTPTGTTQVELAERLHRLERSYIVLLKRVLEIDGVQFMPNKAASLNAKVMHTPKQELHKGLNEPEPTIH